MLVDFGTTLRTCLEVGWLHPSARVEECLYAPKLGVMLVVYVDDFKMAGPKENLSKAWDLVKSKIKMEEAAPIKRYLGCEHVQFEHTVSVHLIHE